VVFEFTVLSQEAFVAHHQKIVILDTIIHSALRRAFIRFELYNTLVEWCSAVLSDDSFGSSSHFDNLIQKGKLKTQQ
jgi:DNA-binding sugar fermentation-stimulating protein